ncbi:element excision factor XisH family protein [Spirosoma rhododendri]|uniref:element excision factor XisH family protein n=1 Tax=Spirosoma rhododendri TaxID=2728024 RepID=UPI0038CD1810
MRDYYHKAARTALENDGWVITDDPLDLTIGDVTLFADLGAERVIGAVRGKERIAVEPGRRCDQVVSRSITRIRVSQSTGTV